LSTIRTLLHDLTSISGIAGHENLIARAMADYCAPYAAEVRIDRLNNMIARFGEGTPRIAVLAHMDTLGLMVKRIDADGLLGVVQVGGVNLKALPGAAVRVGDMPGVIGVRSQHLSRPGDTVINIDDLTIQVDPAAQVEVTMPITYAPQWCELGSDLCCAPYLDNRAGCAVLVEVARRLAETPAPGTVYLIGTVQEETTCAGAMSALQAVNPDIALFVDGTVSHDTPDTQAQGMVRLGAGPVLTAFLYVSGMNGWHAHPGLRAQLKQIAVEAGIPFQQDAVRGLISDARVSTWLGIPSAVIGLPLRGKHAPLETIHSRDVERAVDLLCAALRRPLIL
jgi:putative aminopeptidase FrvX